MCAQVFLDGSNTGSITCARVLTLAEKRELLEIVEGHTPAGLTIVDAFPKFIRIPSVSNAEAFSLVGNSYNDHELQDLSISLEEATQPTFALHRWWTTRQAHNDSTVFDTSPSDGLQVRG